MRADSPHRPRQPPRRDGHLARGINAADRRRVVGGDDRRLLLPAEPTAGDVPAGPTIGGPYRRLPFPRPGAAVGGGDRGADPYRSHVGLRVVAERTEAVLVGGASAANVGRGHGLAEDRLPVAAPGQPLVPGSYDVTLVESEHCPPDRFPGVITAPPTPPVRASAYRCGETWSTLAHHRLSGRRLLIQGSAGFLPGALAGHRAEVVKAAACLTVCRGQPGRHDAHPRQARRSRRRRAAPADGLAARGSATLKFALGSTSGGRQAVTACRVRPSPRAASLDSR